MDAVGAYAMNALMVKMQIGIKMLKQSQDTDAQVVLHAMATGGRGGNVDISV